MATAAVTTTPASPDAYLVPSQPLTNRSCVWIGQKKLEVQNRPLPPPLGDEDVLVEVISTGIYGSDCHNWESDKITKQLVLGHESAGVVAGIGSKVTDRHVGQRVAIEPGFACNECDYCIRGNPNTCANLKYCGLDPTDGTLCQFFRCKANMTVPIPESVTWKEAGCIQPLAIGIQLARRAGLRPHQTVAVFGCGPLGLLVMAVARAYGARKIIAFDIEQGRVDFAKAYCADIGVVVSPRKSPDHEPLTTTMDFIKLVFDGHSLGDGVDIAVEATGAEACMQMAVIAAKPGATVIQAGLGGALSSVPIFLVMSKELNMKGTVRYTAGCFSDTIDLIQRRLVNLEPLVTSTFPLTKANEAFQA